MRAFATERITGITLEAGNRINAELGRVVIGAQTPFQAVESVSQILGEATLKRANTIVHTQLAQAHSAATQLRMEQIARDAVPELEKRWIKSGKREPRLNHAVINGQVQPAGKPFKLNGGRLLMMCPHDPAAPSYRSRSWPASRAPRTTRSSCRRHIRTPMLLRRSCRNRRGRS